MSSLFLFLLIKARRGGFPFLDWKKPKTAAALAPSSSITGSSFPCPFKFTLATLMGMGGPGFLRRVSGPWLVGDLREVCLSVCLSKSVFSFFSLFFFVVCLFLSCLWGLFSPIKVWGSGEGETNTPSTPTPNTNKQQQAVLLRRRRRRKEALLPRETGGHPQKRHSQKT